MGIGPKTAAPLIEITAVWQIFGKRKADAEKVHEKIVKSKDIALLFKKLAVIRRDAPLDVSGLSELTTMACQKSAGWRWVKVMAPKNSGL